MVKLRISLSSYLWRNNLAQCAAPGARTERHSVYPFIGLARYRQAWLLVMASAISMNFSAEAITALAPD